MPAPTRFLFPALAMAATVLATAAVAPGRAQAQSASVRTDQSHYAVGDTVRICYTVPGPGPIKLTVTIPEVRTIVVAEGIDDGRGDCVTTHAGNPAGERHVRLDYSGGHVRAGYEVGHKPAPKPAPTPTGALYEVALEGLRLRNGGCDGGLFDDRAPEVYYSFYVNSDVVANRGSSDFVLMRVNDRHVLNASKQVAVRNGESLRIIGYVYDDDSTIFTPGAFERIAEFYEEYTFPVPTYDLLAIEGLNGCSLQLDYRITKVKDLFD